MLSRRVVKSDYVFDIFVYAFLSLFLVVTLYPLWQQVVLSISPLEEAMASTLHMFVMKPQLGAYETVLGTSQILKAVGNTVYRTVLGTVVAILLQSMMAYPLAKAKLPLNKALTILLLFTQVFSGGLIPSYLLMHALGLRNTILALILPGAVGAYNVVILRNFMRSLPDSLEESAEIDGASPLYVWARIIVPLSIPAIATITLWMVVFYWNAYMDALLFMSERDFPVLQVVLRRILIDNETAAFMSNYGIEQQTTYADRTLQAAVIMVTSVPMLLIYLFFQKYYVQGIMLGAVKE